MGPGHSGLERQYFRREEVHPDQNVPVALLFPEHLRRFCYEVVPKGLG